MSFPLRNLHLSTRITILFFWLKICADVLISLECLSIPQCYPKQIESTFHTALFLHSFYVLAIEDSAVFHVYTKQHTHKKKVSHRNIPFTLTWKPSYPHKITAVTELHFKILQLNGKYLQNSKTKIFYENVYDVFVQSGLVDKSVTREEKNCFYRQRRLLLINFFSGRHFVSSDLM